MKRIHWSALASLAFAASCLAQGQLIAVDSNRTLYSIDMNTGAKTQIGTVSSNAGTTAGLAYDCATQTIYLTSTSNDSVFTLDLASGNATLIGFYGDAALVMHGIEWDGTNHVLYGGSNGNLYTINTSTGVATLVGASGLTSFTNLGYNSDTDTLYATNSGADSFYVVDRATGAMTLIGALGTSTNPNSLAYNADNQQMYMIDNTTDNLYTIDMATGVATTIGPVGSSNILGLAYISPNCAGSPNPYGTPVVSPSSVSNCGDESILLSITVNPGEPAAPPHTVVADMSGIGGSGAQQLFDDGGHEDGAPGDNVFAFRQTVSYTTPAGPRSIPFTVSDAQNRSTNGVAGFTVSACTQLGACCVAGNCSVISAPACAAQSGSFQGLGTDCGQVSYAINQGGANFEDISSTGTLASTASDCDDCVQQGLPIGFDFSFFENTYNQVNVSSNGNLQFAPSASTAFTNTAIPNPAVPNNMIAPMWDDLNTLQQGDIYYETRGSAPNRRFIVLWYDTTQFNLATHETFEAVLFEGTNDIEFRYLSVTPEATNGDYTVGVENAAGSVGYSIPGATIGGGDSAFTVDYSLSSNPCEGGNCPWNAPGSGNCVADYNGSGGTPDDADVSAFFSAWNNGDECADANQSGGTPDDADVATFFQLWNNGGC